MFLKRGERAIESDMRCEVVFAEVEGGQKAKRNETVCVQCDTKVQRHAMPMCAGIAREKRRNKKGDARREREKREEQKIALVFAMCEFREMQVQ